MSRPKRIARAAAAALMTGVATTSLAGGFGIATQNGSGTGNAFAGGAAVAEDASTVWYNPAGMTALPGTTNFGLAAQILKPSFKFQNTGSTLPIGTGEGGDGGDWTYIPQGFITHKLSDKWSVGAAFNTPFGLKTEYDAGWRGQSIALTSDLKTFNFNLSAAYKINDMWSVGAGINYLKAELKFNSRIAIGFVEPNLNDGGIGYNFGVAFQPTQNTRIGAHYRSTINLQATGSLTAPAAIGGSGSATAGLTTPDTFSLSALHAITPQWDIMGDATWTGWNHLQRLSVVRTSGPLTGTAPVSLTFNWSNTWRSSIGANYKPNATWKFRAGVAYDKTPTNDVDRTPRLPDQDRTWLALGAQMRVSKAGTVDVGYAHEFIKDASVNNVAPVTGLRLVGQFQNQVDIFSIQYSHSF
jgi:long-chain fatty acid transport protein